MDAANVHNKLILAVVQEDDYDATVSELNQNGFFVTMLSSTGGFWKKKNITIMLGVEESRLSEAMDILKRCAGKRKQTVYSSVSMPAAGQYAAAMPSIPMNMEFGGVTVFVLDLGLRNFLCLRAPHKIFSQSPQNFTGQFKKSVGNQHILCYNKHIVIFIISSKL